MLMICLEMLETSSKTVLRGVIIRHVYSECLNKNSVLYYLTNVTHIFNHFPYMKLSKSTCITRINRFLRKMKPLFILRICFCFNPILIYFNNNNISSILRIQIPFKIRPRSSNKFIVFNCEYSNNKYQRGTRTLHMYRSLLFYYSPRACQESMLGPAENKKTHQRYFRDTLNMRVHFLICISADLSQ